MHAIHLPKTLLEDGAYINLFHNVERLSFSNVKGPRVALSRCGELKRALGKRSRECSLQDFRCSLTLSDRSVTSHGIALVVDLRSSCNSSSRKHTGMRGLRDTDCKAKGQTICVHACVHMYNMRLQTGLRGALTNAWRIWATLAKDHYSRSSHHVEYHSISGRVSQGRRHVCDYGMAIIEACY